MALLGLLLEFAASAQFVTNAQVANTQAAVTNPETVEDVKRRFALLRPSMTSQQAEAVLGLATLTEKRLVATCGGFNGPSIAGNYWLRGGYELFLSWENTLTRSERQPQLISGSLWETGKAPEEKFQFWVKPKYDFYAEVRTNECAELRSQALQAQEPQVIAFVLESILQDSPWPKQIPGSTLDSLVAEVERKAIADVIAHLKDITKRDLGPDAQEWIQRFSPTRASSYDEERAGNHL